MSYLDELVRVKLSGDENRVTELFQDESIFDELLVHAKDSDWYHFEAKTFDGEYFIKSGSTYLCYQQERGSKSPPMSFNNINDAAIFYFTNAGYIKPKPIKKWWQFWV